MSTGMKTNARTIQSTTSPHFLFLPNRTCQAPPRLRRWPQPPMCARDVPSQRLLRYAPIQPLALHRELVPRHGPRCDDLVPQGPLLLWRLTFFHTLWPAFLPPQRQYQYHSPVELSLHAVPETVLILISHRPTSETTQLIPDGLIPSRTFTDGPSIPTNPSTVSSPFRAEHPAGLVPPAYLSTYTPLPTPGNTYLPQFFHSQLPPPGNTPNSNGILAHLPRLVQTPPVNRIRTNSQMIPHRPGARAFNG